MYASKRLPDALLAVETPEEVSSDPDGLITTWINDYFHEIETGNVLGAGLLTFQQAEAVIRICLEYQHVSNRAEQSVLP